MLDVGARPGVSWMRIHRIARNVSRSWLAKMIPQPLSSQSVGGKAPPQTGHLFTVTSLSKRITVLSRSVTFLKDSSWSVA